MKPRTEDFGRMMNVFTEPVGKTAFPSRPPATLFPEAYDYARSRKGISFPSQVRFPSEKALYGRNKRDGYSRDHGPLDFCVAVDWRESAREYCRNTSLHGLKYVGDPELNLFERLFWSVMFILGVLAAGYFITILYNRWRDNPMIISLSPKSVPVKTIPFPAVTICNMNGVRKSVAEGIDQSQATDSKTLFEKHMVRKMCGEVDTSKGKVNASWNEIQFFMVKVSQSCSNMLVKCTWGSEIHPCGDLFNPHITDEGLCCSFNKVKRKFIYRNERELLGLNYTFPYPAIDWTPEKGYPANASSDSNPWRAMGPGKALGLSIILDAELSDYYCSSTASVGFKLLLHSPVETPRISEFAYYINPGHETRVEITPKISTTTEALVRIPESKRRCVFASERELRYYRTYTQRNCQLECLSNFTMKHCNCVPFYLPKDVKTRICGTADDECVDMIKGFFDNTVQGTEAMYKWSRVEDQVNCSCLASCVQIFYNRQMSTSHLDDSFKVQDQYLNGKDQEYYKKNMAIVHFFFVDHSFTSFEKGEIFGFTDFLSSTGGLLGLFLGFSFMSFAEIAYYTTIKIMCSRRNLRQVRTGHRFSKGLPFAQ